MESSKSIRREQSTIRRWLSGAIDRIDSSIAIPSNLVHVMLEPSDGAIFVPVTDEFLRVVSTVANENSRNELLLIVGQYLRDGVFRVNTRLLRPSVYRTLRPILDAICTETDGYKVGSRSKARIFKFSIPVGGLRTAAMWAAEWIKIPARWLAERDRRWGEIITRYGWRDHRESHAEFRCDNIVRMHSEHMSRVSVPVLSDEDCEAMADSSSNSRGRTREEKRAAYKVIQQIVSKGFRDGRFIKGRFYHDLLAIPKTQRSMIRIDGESTCEVDMSATYPTIIASLMPPGDDKKRAIRAIQSGDFYRLIGDQCRVSYAPAELKANFQKQVVFYRDSHCESTRPLAQAVRAWNPTFAATIDRYRDKLPGATGSGFSELLNGIEADIFVHGAFSELASLGIPTITIHDALLCRQSDRTIVQATIIRHAIRVLGFRPIIK